MKCKAFRFMYRKPGESGWTVPLALTAFNTAEGAAGLVARWNRKDRGEWEWRFDECLPDDVDHPDMRMVVERRWRRQKAKALKACGLA